MEDSQYCRYVRRYSYIHRLQPEHTVVYEVKITPSGAMFRISRMQAGIESAVNCLCGGMDLSAARRLTQYLYENGVDPDGCLDVLQDLGIPYAAVETV
ncbi:hypothetical protein [Dysosmobacter sp.]